MDLRWAVLGLGFELQFPYPLQDGTPLEQDYNLKKLPQRSYSLEFRQHELAPTERRMRSMKSSF